MILVICGDVLVIEKINAVSFFLVAAFIFLLRQKLVSRLIQFVTPVFDVFVTLRPLADRKMIYLHLRRQF